MSPQQYLVLLAKEHTSFATEIQPYI